jgi:transposase
VCEHRPAVAANAAEGVGLYLNPPLHAMVLRVDEKLSIQAIGRSTGSLETDSGAVVRALKSTYKRHGTCLLPGTSPAAMSMGKPPRRRSARTASNFSDGVMAELPPDLEIHVILDNYCTHQRNQEWPAKYEGRVPFPFTPTSASCLNQVEILFSIYGRRTLRGASFESKDRLRVAIQAYLARHNQKPKPFRWRKREAKAVNFAIQ